MPVSGAKTMTWRTSALVLVSVLYQVVGERKRGSRLILWHMVLFEAEPARAEVCLWAFRDIGGCRATAPNATFVSAAAASISAFQIAIDAHRKPPAVHALKQ